MPTVCKALWVLGKNIEVMGKSKYKNLVGVYQAGTTARRLVRLEGHGQGRRTAKVNTPLVEKESKWSSKTEFDFRAALKSHAG